MGAAGLAGVLRWGGGRWQVRSLAEQMASYEAKSEATEARQRALQERRERELAHKRRAEREQKRALQAKRDALRAAMTEASGDHRDDAASRLRAAAGPRAALLPRHVPLTGSAPPGG
eukprot:COSAG01_NODE_2788_length_7077_cov_32.146604_2_plen_117_part_00